MSRVHCKRDKDGLYMFCDIGGRDILAVSLTHLWVFQNAIDRGNAYKNYRRAMGKEGILM